jgi:two-component system sensor histidine kinase KdpD
MKDMLKDHPLHVDVPPDLPLVMGDFALLEHVIINLLENGVKYSPPHEEISISVRLSGRMLSVTVADRGPAISVPDGKRIFDKFYRLDSSRHISGTGLGLSICKGIIEAHEGTIGVESVKGQGNRFTFSLPIPEQPLERLDRGKG